MQSTANDWQTKTPRPEISPIFERDGDLLLLRATGDPAVYGAWCRRIDGITPASHYRLAASYRAQDLPNAPFCATARLLWLDAAGQRINPPDYATETRSDGEWTHVELLAPSPVNAVAALVEVSLRWSATGSVRWRDISLEQQPSPTPRQVRIATVGLRPRDTGSADVSVGRFCELLKATPGQMDLICLPEGVSVVGTGKSYFDVAQSLSGPVVRRLADLAKEKRSYVVAGVYEREGTHVYNTAILLDRDGRLVGKYRKVHIPREEAEGGITPGDEYPVFDTDFGRLGILICWDLQFPEPARALALKGAEIIALPIWGGSEVLARARAIENHVYLISASYDMRTMIVDPTGEVLAETTQDRPLAYAAIDLNRIVLQLPWLGNMKTRTWKERCPGIAV